MLNDFSRMEVLITGGTQGIGLATGVAFAQQGAQCTLTYSWGSVEEDEVRAVFANAGCPKTPRLIQADVADEDATEQVLGAIEAEAESLDVFISNVAISASVMSIDDYDFRSLCKSLQYTAWPMVDYTRRIIQHFSRPPRYILGYSSAGPDRYVANYDIVAATKAVMETWCRYLTFRLFDEDCRVNVIRAERVETTSAKGLLGEGAFEFAQRYFPECVLSPEAIAKAALALCSGLMDAVRGQVINIDRGSNFYQNVMFMYDEQRLGKAPGSES